MSFNRFSDFQAGGDGYNERTTLELLGEARELGEMPAGTSWVLALRAGDASMWWRCAFSPPLWWRFRLADEGGAGCQWKSWSSRRRLRARHRNRFTLDWGAIHFFFGPAALAAAGLLIIAYRTLFPFGFVRPRMAT